MLFALRQYDVQSNCSDLPASWQLTRRNGSTIIVVWDVLDLLKFTCTLTSLTSSLITNKLLLRYRSTFFQMHVTASTLWPYTGSMLYKRSCSGSYIFLRKLNTYGTMNSLHPLWDAMILSDYVSSDKLATYSWFDILDLFSNLFLTSIWSMVAIYIYPQPSYDILHVCKAFLLRLVYVIDLQPFWLFRIVGVKWLF